MGALRRVWIESLTGVLFIAEFITNILRFVGLGRRYYRKDNRIDGQTVVITGANSGIGKETAYQLSKRGAKVIMCCRNEKNGNNAAAEIRMRHPEANLTVMTLDLSSLDSVRQFASRLRRQTSQVDILINNAGVMMCPKLSSKDNNELQFATNHLGHFLLTQHILPLMSKSNDARILNVSSVHHVRGQIFFDDINFENTGYDPTEAYCQSKMANVLFSNELARQLRTNHNYRNIKSYSLNPGTINTNLTRHVQGVRKIMFNIIGTMFNLDIYTGTQTTLYCALEPSLRNQSGYYYSNCRRNSCIFKESTDPKVARKLWNISCQMVGIGSDQYFNQD